jgi:uncharacterized membrane protein
MKRRVLVYGILLVAGVLSLLGCGGQPGMVNGSVVRIADSSAVAQAQVTVFGLNKLEEIANTNAFQKGDAIQTVTTDEDGAFSVTLEPDSYVLEVQAEGLEVTTHLVEVKSSRAIEVTIRMADAMP